MSISAAQANHWRTLTTAAPPGPWKSGEGLSTSLTAARGLVLGELKRAETGAFIVAAREAVPALLDERDALLSIIREIAARPGPCLACGGAPDGRAAAHAPGCRVGPFLDPR